MVRRFAARLLGRHVVHRAENRPGVGHGAALGQRSRDPEVGDVGVAVAIDQDVRRLQIAVHDAGVVRRLQRLADLPGQGKPLVERQRPLALQEALEVRPLDVVHRDETDLAGLPEVVDPQDVLVGHLAGEQDLALEAFQDLRPRRHLRPDDLERHEAPELAIPRLVDRPHAALTEDRQDLVARSKKSSRRQADAGGEAGTSGRRGRDTGGGQGAIAARGGRRGKAAKPGERRNVGRESRPAGGALCGCFRVGPSAAGTGHKVASS